MNRVPARELRNDVSGVLRKVEAGESLEVTLRGRPVARLTPVPRRARWISTAALFVDKERWLADSGLRRDLAELLPDTTDDMPLQ